MSKYAVGQEVEVFVIDFDTPGFPEVWKRGIVDRIEPIGNAGRVQVFVRWTKPNHVNPLWAKPVVGVRGGNRSIRPVA